MTQTINITEAAVEAMKNVMREENLASDATYLRVGVKAGGCSGFSYDLQFVPGMQEGDRVIERDGVRLVIDPKSEELLGGTELDYTSGLNGKGFVFRNPNASGTCGCGESFSV